MCYRSIFNASIMPINTPYNVLYDLMNNCNHRYNIYLSVPIGYYPFTNYNESKPMTNNKSTFYFVTIICEKKYVMSSFKILYT